MPSTFQQPSNFTSLYIDSVNTFLKIQQTIDNIYYYTLINQLYLLYILQPSGSQQSIYSKITCINASHKLLTQKIAIYTFNPVATCSYIADFIALIAGITLMLAHIMSHYYNKIDNLLIHQQLSNCTTMEQALKYIKSMSKLQDNILAAKCGLLLQDLLAVEANATQGQNHRAHILQETNREQGNKYIFNTLCNIHTPLLLIYIYTIKLYIKIAYPK